MHPQPFVAKLVSEGKTDALVQIVREYSDRLNAKKSVEHQEAYAFANAFLIGVLSQLGNLEPGQSLDDDKLLSVWADLGLFGIEREVVRAFLVKGGDAAS
jgi:hypothetical protein